MKNKDLFEAIDKIDDELINGAGKYLGGYVDTDPVEVRPASRKVSAMKLAAPIAATLAVVCGVTIAVGMKRPSTYSPGAAGVGAVDGENTSSDIGDDETSAPTESEEISSDSSVDETSTDIEKVKEEFHKWDYLYDVDEKYLPIGFDGVKLTNADGEHYLTGDDARKEYEYGGFLPKFLYYADPKGANYNSIDNPEAFEDGFVTDNHATFKRIAEGDKYGGLSVKGGSYIDYARDRENSPNDAPIYYHSGSFMSFDGWLMIEDAYLVKMPGYDGVYYCIPRNGEAPLPIINATTLEDGSFGALPYEGNLGGIEYKTEIPPIVVRLREDQQQVIDKYFEAHSYAKVRVHLTDIDMWCLPGEWYKIYSEGNIISIQSGDAEPKEVAAFINAQTSASKLEADLVEKFGFTDARVVFNFSDLGVGVTLDTPVDPEDAPRWGEDELVKGMAVKVYDENGLCGIYTYGDRK